MLSVVLVAVVGVHSMRHVSADQEAVLDAALHCAFLPLGQHTGHPVDGVLHHRPPGTCANMPTCSAAFLIAAPNKERSFRQISRLLRTGTTADAKQQADQQPDSKVVQVAC